MLNISSPQRRAVAEEWLALTLQTYPSQSMKFMLRESDAFRNPIGQTLKDAIPLLVDEVFGEMDSERIRQPLESIVRIRAVQNFSAREAVEFVFPLKKILQEKLPDHPESCRELDSRVDELALVAFDLYVQCRTQISDIQVNEARRRVAQLERIYSEVEGR